MKHGLTKATLIKCIKELNDLKLLHIIQHTERNKTKYKIDYNNYNELLKIIKKETNKKARKNIDNKKQFQKVVLNLYNEYLKNNTTSSDKFNTTDKDLKEKELIRKRNKCSRHFLYENVSDNNKPNNVNFYNNGKFIETITYRYIPMLFKEIEDKEEIHNYFSGKYYADYDTLNTLEYFLMKYKERYGEYHPKISLEKIISITKQIRDLLDNNNIAYEDLDYTTFIEIINEYFNTKNTTKSRELTLYLFLSQNEYGLYMWINTLYIRLYGAQEANMS